MYEIAGDKPTSLTQILIGLTEIELFDNNKLGDFINENYYAVKFNGEGTELIKYKEFVFTNPNHNPEARGRNSQHQFTGYLRVQGYPSMYVFDKKGEIKSPIVGYHTPEQLLPLLK